MPARSQTIRAEDLFRFELIRKPRLSPDGRHVVYAQIRVDSKTLKKSSNLWVVPTAGGLPRQFTFGDQSDSSPQWSPDGKWIAFLSNRADREKPDGIYLIPFDGGEARPLTDIAGEIGDFAWSPDGRRILCNVRKTDAEQLAREADENRKKLGVVDRVVDRVYYKLDGYGYLPKERWHIWMADTRNGKARQLTDHPVFDELFPTWSPDAKTIAFLSNRTENPDFTYESVDLFVMPAAGGEFRRIPTPVGEKSLPSFSPDGKWIAYFANEGVAGLYRNTGVYIVPADGSAASRNLTARYDLHASPWTINDLGDPEGMPPTWSQDGQWIYFQESFHGSTMLRKIHISGEPLHTVVGEGGVVGSFNFSSDQSQLACFYGRMDDPNQICMVDLKTGQLRPLTRLNAWLEKVDLGHVEEVWVQGADHNNLQGWILTPPGFDPTRKYPSILQVHGGPLTQYGFYFMHEFYYLAAQGFVVHFTNPRGGRGYGEAHSLAIKGAWGGADYADLMAWTDMVARRPYIDTERMGVTGGSYGGYMTLWVIGHTPRFKAAVAGRCVSNFISLWGSSDFNWTFEQELDARAPYQGVDKYWDLSPHKYLGNAVTPTLVIHNEMDLRCPIEQGEQAFVALKRAGVETRMVRFPDEPHGLSRIGRTDRRIARLNHILDWFKTHL